MFLYVEVSRTSDLWKAFLMMSSVLGEIIKPFSDLS